MKKTILVALLLPVAFNSNISFSEPTQVYFTGVISEIWDESNQLDDQFVLGASFTGYAVYENEMTDPNCWGVFPQPNYFEFSVTIGAETFLHAENLSGGMVQTGNLGTNCLNTDSMDVASEDNNESHPLFGPIRDIRIMLADYSGQVLDANDTCNIPAQIPELEYWTTYATLKIMGGDSETHELDWLILGNLTSLSAVAVDNDNDGFEVNWDCNDNDPGTYPGADELCDGADNNCDGIIPDDEIDLDGDGFLACNDCDDHNININLQAIEIPGNYIDENCDGDLGDCWPCLSWKSHGEYVRCTVHAVHELVASGLITDDQASDIVSSSAWSGVGKRDYIPPECR